MNQIRYGWSVYVCQACKNDKFFARQNVQEGAGEVYCSSCDAILCRLETQKPERAQQYIMAPTPYGP